MKKICLFFAIVLSFLILYSCSDWRRDSQLVIYGLTEIDGVSMSANHNFFQTWIENLLFNSPALLDINYQYHNILIEDTWHSSDWKVWRIRLRDGVRFHNSKPFSTGDVEFSIKKMMEAGRARYSVIREINIVNDRELLLMLDIPTFEISDLLDISVYPAKLFKVDEPWQKTVLENPIGSGPFRFSRWLNKGMEFTANDDYFDGRPEIDKVAVFYEVDENRKLNLLLKGEADLLTPVSPKAARFLERDSRFHVTKAITPYYAAIFLNNKSPLFKDKVVRRALNMAIDGEWLIGKGLEGAGTPASGPFMQRMLPDWYKPLTYGYDPKKAVQLLKEGGWNGSRKRLKFKLYYSSDIYEMKRLADILSRQLFEAGVEVECIPVKQDDFLNKKLVSGEYDALLTIQNAFSNNKIWQSLSIHGSNSLNFSNYSNKDVDRLFNQAKNTPDGNEKKGKYGEIDRIIHEDAPAVFLYSPVWFSAVSKRFKGAEDFKGDPYSFYKIKDWSIDESFR